jgi:hypothetical protein
MDPCLCILSFRKLEEENAKLKEANAKLKEENAELYLELVQIFNKIGEKLELC